MTSKQKPTVVKFKGPTNDWGREKNNGRNFVRQNNATPAKFKGKTKDLKGCVYDVEVKNWAQLFVNTTKEIAEYAERKLKESQDIFNAIKKLTDISLDMPAKPTEYDATTNNIVFKHLIDLHIKRQNLYRQNKASMYSVVLGQCSKAMRAKLEGDHQFNVIKEDTEIIALCHKQHNK